MFSKCQDNLPSTNLARANMGPLCPFSTVLLQQQTEPSAGPWGQKLHHFLPEIAMHPNHRLLSLAGGEEQKDLPLCATVCCTVTVTWLRHRFSPLLKSRVRFSVCNIFYPSLSSEMSQRSRYKQAYSRESNGGVGTRHQHTTYWKPLVHTQGLANEPCAVCFSVSVLLGLDPLLSPQCPNLHGFSTCINFITVSLDFEHSML